MQLSSNKRTGLSVAAAIAVVAITAAVAVATTRADKPPALLPPTPCGTSNGKGCAPDSDRVDLQQPRFTHPTSITNPLFPISTLRSVVLLGKVDGKPFRSETTLLPRTATVDWDGQPIEVVLSQYVAYLDGRIQEIALDRYAQADDGSVWYLGEDVFDYVDGSIAISEGTWLAGRDGPPAMIMPAHPKPGQAFRAENITGVVFEELRVRDVDVTVDGPSGKVPGAVTMDELHVDGVTVSGKTFAPGYGEFLTLDKPDVEALAIAHGTDSRPGPTPAPITHLVTAAWGFLEQIRLEDWEAAARGAALVRADRSALPDATLPPLVLDQLDVAVHDLERATTAKDPDAGADAAIRVAQSALDLELLTRAPVAVDIERAHLHAQALRVAAAAGDKPGVNAEIAVLGWLADRVGGHLRAADQAELESRLGELRLSPNPADTAARLAAWLRSTHPAPGSA
jgi:hypothetical protein